MRDALVDLSIDGNGLNPYSNGICSMRNSADKVEPKFHEGS